MKAVIKNWVLGILRLLARHRLAQIRPKVIGITGSAGKTSGKEMIYDVLSRRLKTKKSEKSFNSEFGAVLTILDLKSGYSSFWSWLGILLTALIDYFRRPDSYEALVMEMGVDKPGDMDEILKVLTPEIMVFLNVKDVHLGSGHFANRQAIFEEKSKACGAVPPEGWVVLNQDDPFVRQLKDHLPAHTLTIGEEEGADLRATQVDMDQRGLKFVLEYEGKQIPVLLPNVLGRQHVSMCLAAIAVGFLNGMPWTVIELALKEYHMPQGRMNLIDGKNGSILIDSSYNASPDTMTAALDILNFFNGRKIAALGTMNELGELSESEHMKIGKKAAEHADMLLAVGDRAKDLAEGAERGGLSSSMIHIFQNSKEAGAFLEKVLERGDIVLIKGSQNRVRMEHVVKICMRHPEKARELLVRQDPYWLTHY